MRIVSLNDSLNSSLTLSAALLIGESGIERGFPTLKEIRNQDYAGIILATCGILFASSLLLTSF